MPSKADKSKAEFLMQTRDDDQRAKKALAELDELKKQSQETLSKIGLPDERDVAERRRKEAEQQKMLRDISEIHSMLVEIRDILKKKS